jgi:hypothetical protein
MADLDGGGELDQVELLLLLQRLRQKRGGTEERLSDAWASTLDRGARRRRAEREREGQGSTLSRLLGAAEEAAEAQMDRAQDRRKTESVWASWHAAEAAAAREDALRLTKKALLASTVLEEDDGEEQAREVREARAKREGAGERRDSVYEARRMDQTQLSTHMAQQQGRPALASLDDVALAILSESFARWDVDGDAVLDIDEFRNLWHELSVAAYLPPQPAGYEGRAPLSVTVAPKLSEEEMLLAYEHADIDGSGVLDINEVAAALTHAWEEKYVRDAMRLVHLSARIKDAFKVDELRRALPVAARLMREMDADSDGVVTLHEFCTGFGELLTQASESASQ